MTRQYATPAAFKQALEQRLRTQAAGDGVELARLRQLLVFDRFLARVSAAFGDQVVLKGAFAGVQPASIRIFPLETHIAEKLHAYTMPRSRPNSRVKDLPDIALLATVRSLEAAALRSAIDGTFTARGTHDVSGALPRPPSAWEPVYAHIAETDQLRWAMLDEVHQAAAAFLDPVLSGFAGRWHPGAWEWRGGSVDPGA